MKLLVIGAGGQVGYDLSQAAHEQGIAVIPFRRGDLDLSTVTGIGERLVSLDFDIAINCGAYTDVDRAESDATRAFAVNAYAVEQIAHACAATGRMLVHLSTDYVFDGESSVPYAPDAPPSPISVYGASKLVGEILARRTHPRGTVIVRTSSVFGLGAPDHQTRNFVETILRLGMQENAINVAADTSMAPTYSSDLADALVRLIASAPEPGIFHVTNTGSTSWYGFARAILAMKGVAAQVNPIKAVEYPRPARRPRFSVLDTERTRLRIGALRSWEDGLSRYLKERRGNA